MLVGFHSSAEKELKKQQVELSTDHPLGRDSLAQFNFWRKDLAASRVVCTMSELFGPVGEHTGIRDLWESNCAENGIKSHISNYRDNRFDCIFENAAQIRLNLTDLLTVLSLVKAPNQKVVSVSADLKSKRLTDSVLVLAIYIYIHVTGPFWQICEFGAVKYIDLGCKYIQPLLAFIEQCIDNPASLEDPANTNPLAEFHTSRLREYESTISMANANDTPLLP